MNAVAPQKSLYSRVSLSLQMRPLGWEGRMGLAAVQTAVKRVKNLRDKDTETNNALAEIALVSTLSGRVPISDRGKR
jgi:hypothetical protein